MVGTLVPKTVFEDPARDAGEMLLAAAGPEPQQIS